MGALMLPEGLFETHSTSSAPSTTTTEATLLDTVGVSKTTPVTLWILASVITLAIVTSLVAWTAYKMIIGRRRAASFMAPSSVSPTPLITNIRVVAVTEVPAKFEEDETMKSVRDFWSPISPGPPELHVEYKNLDISIGTVVDPTTTRLPLLARDASGFFYDSDHLPATQSAGMTECTLKGPPSSDLGVSTPAPEAELTDEAAHHTRISVAPVMEERGVGTPPSTSKSVRTMCTLTSISSLSMHSVETPTEASSGQRSVLATVNRIPVIRIIEASPERSEKAHGCAHRFNSRAITPKQARLQNLI